MRARRQPGDGLLVEALRNRRPDGRRKRVGVLGGSSADRYVTAEFGNACEVVRYEGTTETFLLVKSGQLDATVQDLPPLIYYLKQLKRYPELAIVDRPVQPGYYVLYGRLGDASLIREIDAAIRRLYDSGRLRQIYEKYGLWNASQEQLPAVWTKWPPDDSTGELGVFTQDLRAASPVVFTGGRDDGAARIFVDAVSRCFQWGSCSAQLIRGVAAARAGGMGGAGTIAGRVLKACR